MGCIAHVHVLVRNDTCKFNLQVNNACRKRDPLTESRQSFFLSPILRPGLAAFPLECCIGLPCPPPPHFTLTSLSPLAVQKPTNDSVGSSC